MDFDVEQINRINSYVKKFNKTITTDDEDLLEYSIETVINRVLLYLNHETLAVHFERIVADVVGEAFLKYKNTKDKESIDLAISKVSDNGQSVAYTNELKTYFNSASDKELFGSFVGLMNKYRRANVVTAT